MSTIVPTKLFRLRSVAVVFPEFGPAITLKPGKILWMHYSRKSSLGGYIGHFDHTYRNCFGYSPVGNPFFLSTDLVEPIE